MAIFRFYPTKDSWITNRVEPLLSEDGTLSNHGRSPALNIFAISGSELARSLVDFDIDELNNKIGDGTIPSSSVQYVFKMFNMLHDDPTPSSFDLFVHPVSSSWVEGEGLDDDLFRDKEEVNWLSSSISASWTNEGGDFLTSHSASQHFDSGFGDLEVDVTTIVDAWVSGTIPIEGLIVKLGDSEEAIVSGGFYAKLFHGRETLYIDSLPYLEARWDDSEKDNRNNFSYDVDNDLYAYRFIRGELTSFTEPVIVRIQDHVEGVSASFSQEFTASQPSTGIAKTSLNVVSTSSFSSSWTDIWYSGSTVYLSGTFTPLLLTGSQFDPYKEFDVQLENLRRIYDVSEEVRFKVSVKEEDFTTHFGNQRTGTRDRRDLRQTLNMETMFYSVVDDRTNKVVVPFGTGSTSFTKLSYDKDGNYFNFNMQCLVPGFTYRFLFLIENNTFDKKIVDENFRFKVV